MLGTLACANPLSANAQSTLGMQLYPGLSITGAVGTVYAIQSSANVADSNSWITVNFIQLPATNYLWIDTSAAATGQRFYRALATAPTNLVFIPPGTFRMGSPTNELNRSSSEGPQTMVTITKGFYMGKYEVTQTNYQSVVGTNPSFFNANNPNNPVETVSWFEATNYCAQRTQQELALGLIPRGSHYRLPTEAEWEYACRAWTSDRTFFYGDDIGYTNLTNYAWNSTNSASTTHPVGQKLPNQWGLHDMAGNVFEWCQDWFGSSYPGGNVTDPQGPTTGVARVQRGGAYQSPAQTCRSALRGFNNPTTKGSLFGFRVVLVSGQ
jgi:formylglycine-generating enzyme required for sulfatase activity